MPASWPFRTQEVAHSSCPMPCPHLMSITSPLIVVSLAAGACCLAAYPVTPSAKTTAATIVHTLLLIRPSLLGAMILVLIRAGRKAQILYCFHVTRKWCCQGITHFPLHVLFSAT